MSAKRRVCAIHAESGLPASSAAEAKQNGIANEAKPASTTGGWISMPPSRSTGLSPSPSGGVSDRKSKGLATSASTTRQQVSITAIRPAAQPATFNPSDALATSDTLPSTPSTMAQ